MFPKTPSTEPSHESDVVVVNVTLHSRNSLLSIRDVQKSVGCWERSQKSSHFETLNSF